jgi:hypothetical protein
MARDPSQKRVFIPRGGFGGIGGARKLNKADVPSTPTPSSWGPQEADALVAGHGKRQDPWVVTS